MNLTLCSQRVFLLQAVHNITTEGVNVDAMFARETLLDVNRLFCNNVHDMAKYYGIEAANKTIVREIKDVFQVCSNFFWRLSWIFQTMPVCLLPFRYEWENDQNPFWGFWLKPLQRVFDLDPK